MPPVHVNTPFFKFRKIQRNSIKGVDSVDLLWYIQFAIEKIQQQTQPHAMRLSMNFSVVLADTEYHNCNRFVNNYFMCGLKKFINVRRGFNSHLIVSHEKANKQYIKKGKKMPKLRAKPRETPPVDEAWGTMLARKAQMGLSIKELADATGVSYNNLRHYWNTPPIEWPYGTLRVVLKHLGLEAELVIRERRTQ